MTSTVFSTFSAPSPFREYKWFNSHSVQQELHCGVCRLELPVSIDVKSSSAPRDLWIHAQIVSYGVPVHQGDLSTSFALSDALLNAFVWNTLLNLHTKIKDLSIDASIIFTAWDPSNSIEGKVYGVTSMGLFDENGRLKEGHQKLIFYSTNDHESAEAEPSIDSISLKLNAGYLRKHAIGERYASYKHCDQAFIMEKYLEEYDRPSTSTNQNTQKFLPSLADANSSSHQSNRNQNNWLGGISKARIETIYDEASCRDMLGSGLVGSRTSGNSAYLKKQKSRSSPTYSAEERSLRQLFCLVVELPFPPHPILYKERRYTGVAPHIPPSSLAQMMPPGCGVVVEKEAESKRSGSSNPSDYNATVKDGNTLPSTILEFSLIGGLVGVSGATAPTGSAAFTGASLCIISDWDMDQENLAEQQYRCLAHDILRGKLDPSVKPSLEDKGKIEKILNAAGTHMVFEEMDLLYRYRYFLTENKKALLKFLLTVDWTMESEVAEVPALLAQWKRKAPLDISDALRLLGKEKAFQTLIVRQYAIETLRSASDEELLTFLLQLVQALRYEPPVGVVGEAETASTLRHQDESIYNIASSFSSSFAWTRLGMSASGLGHNVTSDKRSPTQTSSSSTVIGHHGAGLVSPLAQFLIDRACASPIVSNFLYWYLKVETEDEDPSGLLFRQIFDSFLIQLASSTSSLSKHSGTEVDPKDRDRDRDRERDGEQERAVDIFQGAECALQLYALNEYITQIFECHSVARAISGRKDIKQAALRKLLAERGLEKIPCRIEGVPMPLNPRLQIVSLDPSSATMFASAVYPCVIQFNCVENVPYVPPVSTGAVRSQESVGTAPETQSDSSLDQKISHDSYADGEDREKKVEGYEEEDGEGDDSWALRAFDEVLGKQGPESLKAPQRKIVTVKLMFKSGDDLRQDQLVMQMISLMDGLLRKVNLDLKLHTYGILAIGQKDGIMEFVPDAHAISAILKEHKSITKFLRIHNPCPYGPYGTHASAIDAFVKSCAASCVVSYILGVGDRHLDNIMMKTNGQIFHIDYGYCFFQDPKPVQPPPFRFTHHMVEAMGGEDSEHYERFKSFCCQAFHWLRKSANLILNLLSLMGDAGITDISKRSDLPKVLAKVEERFRLDLSDELAEGYFIGLINESLNAIAPRLLEYAHQIAVSVR